MPDMKSVYREVSNLIMSADTQTALLESPNSANIRKEIWQAETGVVYANDFSYACYEWEKIDYNAGYLLRQKLESMSGMEEILSYTDSLLLATFMWRFAFLPTGLIKRLADCALAPGRGHLDATGTDDLFELMIIMAFCKQQNAVARLAKFVGSRPDLRPELRPYVGDCLYLASYHRHRLTGDRSQPAPHIPSPSEAEKIATRIAGEGTLNAGVYKGMTLSLDGQMVAGEKAIQDALEKPGSLMAGLRSARHVSPRRMIKTMVQLAEKGEPVGEPNGAHFSMKIRHQGAGKLCLFVATEKRYFEEFGTVFFASAAATNPGVLIHLHMVDFTLSEEEIKAHEKRHGVQLNISQDTFLKRPGLNAYGDYIVASRFAYLARILPNYGAVFLSDIDGLIHRNLDQYQLLEDPSVLLATRINLEKAISRNALWGCMSGGIFGIANTTDCRIFADAMGHLMLRKIVIARKGGPKVFFADQCGLAQLYLALRKKLSFRSMTGPFFQQAEDVAGTDRFTNKAKWQEAMLKLVQEGKHVSGFWKQP